MAEEFLSVSGQPQMIPPVTSGTVLPASEFLGQPLCGDGSGGWAPSNFPAFVNAQPVPDSVEPTEELSLRVNSGFVGIVAIPASGQPLAALRAPNGGNALIVASTNSGADNTVECQLSVDAGGETGILTTVRVGVNGAGAARTLAFYGVAPIEQPTVSGVSADPVVASIVAALSSLGLVIDGT